MSVKDNGHAVIFLYWTRPPYIKNTLSPGEFANEPLNDRRHDSWNSIAAEFNPNAKVNRFRCIAGNEDSRVHTSNYSIVRVANQEELDAWRYLLRARRMQYDPISGKIFDITYEDIGDNETHSFLFWREGDDFIDGDENFCEQY